MRLNLLALRCKKKLIIFRRGEGGAVGSCIYCLHGRPRPVPLAHSLEEDDRLPSRVNHVIPSAAKDLAIVEEDDRLPSAGYGGMPFVTVCSQSASCSLLMLPPATAIMA